MKEITIVLLIAVSVVGFFVWANQKTKKTHARFKLSDVVDALEDFISPNSYHDDWDLFLRWPIDDLYLESIRERCLRVVQDCPPETATEEISKNGLEQIHSILEELRTAPKPEDVPPLKSP